jgi:hypothetical protein
MKMDSNIEAAPRSGTQTVISLSGTMNVQNGILARPLPVGANLLRA